MKAVIDTNVMLVSISARSPWHPIFLELLRGKYTLCVTTDILDEYAEVIEEEMSFKATEDALEILVSLPNLQKVRKFYFWQLIEKDPDDNKFVDCHVAANADYLVSDDRHFRILKNIPFPKIKVIGKDAFLHVLLKNR